MAFNESSPITIFTHTGGSTVVQNIGVHGNPNYADDELIVGGLAGTQEGDAVLGTAVLADGTEVVISATTDLVPYNTTGLYSPGYSSVQLTTIDTSGAVNTQNLSFSGGNDLTSGAAGRPASVADLQIVPLSGGGFVVAETTVNDTAAPVNDNLYYEVFDSTGAVTKAWTQVNASDAHLSDFFQLRATSTGGFVIQWADVSEHSFYQRFNANGGAADSPDNYLTSSGILLSGGFAVDTAGNVAIILPTSTSVYNSQPIEIFNSSDTPILNEPLSTAENGILPASSNVENDQAIPDSIVALPASKGGGFLAIIANPSGPWNTSSGYPGYNMYVQKITVSGSTVTFGTPALVETVSGDAPDNNLKLLVLSNGNVLLDVKNVYEEIDPSNLPSNTTTPVSFTTPLSGVTLSPSGATISSLAADNAGGLFATLQTGTKTYYYGTLDASLYAADLSAIVPTVSSINRAGANPNNASSEQFTVSFNEAVTGVDTSDFTLAKTGSATGTIASISGSGATYTVTVNGVAGDGSLGLNLNASGTGITDSGGNAISGGFTGQTYTIDHTPPSVDSINRAASTPNNASSDAFTVTFSESVTGVDASDFTLATSDTISDTGGITVSGSGSTYTVTINGVSGDGTLGLNLNGSGTGITDAVGNAIPGGFTGQIYTIEHTPPAVTSVDAPPNATYIAGENLDFTVNFSEAVTVTGTPEIALTLDTGGAVDAQYISGAGSALTFRYTVIGGEADTNGVSLGSAITLNSGAISDAAGNNAVLALNNVASTSGVLVDSIPPTVSSVTAPTGGTYGAGQSLAFTVNFSENVLVTGTPYLTITLDTGGAVQAAYTGGSGSSALTFAYTVVSGNDDTNGVAVGSAITLNGGTIKDAATNAAVLTLNGVASTSNVLVDAIPPTVLSIDTVGSSPNNLTSEDFTVSFSAPVTGVDASDFTLVGTDTASGAIAAVSGSGTTWTVRVGSVAGDGTLWLDLNNTGDAITDTFGNTLTTAHTGDQVYTIEHTPPSVTAMTVPADGTYGAGRSLDFTTTFSEAVNVDTSGGTPRLALTLDTGGTVYADYVSGSGTNTLTFQYTVAAGEQDLTGITTGTSIDINGSSITDAATNAAVLTLNGEPSTSGVDVDAIAPTVSSVSVPSNGTYGTGQDLDFTVDFSKVVTVNTGGGTPYIDVTLDTGGTVQATYLSGSGTSALVFRYVVASGELDTNGVSVGATLVLNGGAIQDAAGNNAAPALNNVASTAGVLVDSIPPTVTSIDLAGSSTNNLTTEAFTVTFSTDVSLSPPNTSDFTLHATGSVGGTIASVTAVSGSTYTVTVTGVTGDGTMRLDLNTSGSTITDSFGNPVTAPHIGDQTYTIQHTPPSPTAMTAPANGAYGVGQTLDFTTTFSEAVTVAGTPRLALTLDTGGTVYANYLSGSGANALTFAYTVLAGEQDLTGISTATSIDANGGTITDAAGNAAVLDVSAVEPSTAGIDVDAISPVVTSVGVPSNATYIAGQDLNFTVNLDKAVTVDTSGGTPYITLTLDTGGTVDAAYISGSGSSSLTFQYIVASGDLDGNGVTLGPSIVLNGATIKDVDANPAALPLNGVPSTSGVQVDAVDPTVSSITTLGSSLNNAGSEQFSVTFSESVTGVTAAAFSLHDTGTVNGTIAAVSGSGASYTVTVSNVVGDGTMQLGVNASGTGIADLATNPLSGGFSSGQTYTLDHTPPAVTENLFADTGSSSSDKITSNDALTGSGDPNATVTLKEGSTILGTATADGAGTWSFTPTLADGSHTIVASETDAAGNTGTASLTFTLDTTAPAVTAINLLGSSPNDAASDQFTVTFSEAVTGVSTSSFALTDTGTVAGTIASVSGSGTTYTVTVDGVTGDGAMRLDLNSSGAGITDAAGNAPSGGYTSGPVYTIEHTAPAVASITKVGSSPNSANSEQFTVTFTEAVTGVAAGDFTLTTTNALGGAALTDTGIASISGSGATYTVTVGGVAGDGTMRLDLNANSTSIVDAAGNGATSAFTGGGVYTIEHTPPTVTQAHISVSGGSGAGGAFEIGDTITAAWNDSATGDDNTDAIDAGGVTFDFSQFGGGSAVVASDSGGDWTATYTIAAGAIDTATAHIAVTATDAAGNATTTAGGPVAVDDVAVAPTITGAAAGQTTTSEAALNPFANVTIGDDNPGATETLTISLSGSGGTLSGAGLTGGSGSYTLSGTAAAVTTELDALSFTATAGAPGTSGTTTFTLSDASSIFATPTVNSATTVTDVDPTGTGWGDVHMVTFQGLHYDFQAVGDFTLAKGTTSADPFDVQIRTSPWASMISVTTEIAAQVGGNAVQFDLDGDVMLNGVVDTSLGSINAVQAIDGGTISRTSADSYVVDWASGESLDVTNAGPYFNETVTLSAKDGPGSVQGLLGSNSNQATDIQLANGTVLNAPTDSQLLGVYAESWSVADSASLLNDNTSLPLAMSNDGDAATPFNGQSFVDLAGLRAASATLGFREDASGAFGTLTIQSGSQQSSMTLLGQYAAAGFGIASDGHGGTIVDYTPPKVTMLG